MDAARDFEQLDEIQAELETQDNQITADPIFAVQVKGRFGQWEMAQPFLTREAAEAYIEANRHNLRSPRVFVASAYRNYEWQLMRRVPKLVASLREALEEREHDMHLRIRAGYDKTVADSWRAANAKLQAENAALGERNAVVEDALRQLLAGCVEFFGKRDCPAYMAGLIRNGKGTLAAEKPAAQEGKETT